jgi:tetratricopeptide (TPR) repeat protein
LDEAKHFYYKSLELMPELSDAWLGLGIVKDLEGDLQAAIGFIEKAISFDTSNPGYLHVLAGALEKTEDVVRTNDTYLQAFSMDITNEEILTDYVSFLVKNTFLKEASSFLEDLESEDETISLVRDLHLFAIRYSYFQEDIYMSLLINAQAINKSMTEEIISLYPDLQKDPKIVNLLIN